jgi:hypothetical protein
MAPVLRILGVGTRDHDLMLRPLDVAVLDAQYLALPTARFDASARELLLLVAVDTPVPFRFVLCSDRYAEAMECVVENGSFWDRRQSIVACAKHAPVDGRWPRS